MGGESGLVYEIMKAVGKRAAVFRTNSGSVRLSDGRQFRALPKGFSDIMAVLPGGRAAFIEVKTGKNKASPEQMAFIEKMRGMGALAGIAYSVDEALEICGMKKREGRL